MKTTLIVPCLNELTGLEEYMPMIDPKWVDQIILLIGQPQLDGSATWGKQKGYDVFVQQKPGLWNAYTELFKSGIVKGDIVIPFAPDGNSVPEDIPFMISIMDNGNYDIVIASRYKDMAKSEDDTFLTGIGNPVLTWACSLRSRYKYTDALNMYRAFKVSLVKELGLLDEPNWLQKRLIKMSNLYSYEPSMAIRAGRAKLRIAEIPSNEPKANRQRRQNTFVHGLTILTQIIHESVR